MVGHMLSGTLVLWRHVARSLSHYDDDDDDDDNDDDDDDGGDIRECLPIIQRIVAPVGIFSICILWTA